MSKNASDFKCIRCEKKAVYFTGGADPDMSKSPQCELHAAAFKYEVILLCSDPEMSYKKACKIADAIAKNDIKGNKK